MPPELPHFGPNFVMYCLGLATYIEPDFAMQSSDNPTLTAIVPAFNEEKSIGKTLESLLNQTRKLKQIIVVDDGSTDRTSEVVKNFRNVILIRNHQRIGKAESINRALKIVSTDFVTIVDADTVLDESFAEESLKTFVEEDVVAANGFVIPDTRSVNAALRKARLVEDIYAQSTIKRGQNSVNGLFVISGCCAVFRTKVLKRFGFPSDTVTEDLDLTWLLLQNCYKTSLINSYAHTLEPRGLKEYIAQIKRWYMGFFQCLAKHGSRIFLSKPLTFTILLILLESLIFTFFWASIIGLIIVSPWLSGELDFLRWLVLTLIVVDVVTVCFPAVFKAKSAGVHWAFISGLPVYYFLRIVNTFVWWSTFAEWLFGYGIIWQKTS
jgi:cellulose synthase/poly-beta-1,6-N-acetylglucosamine synthase-like glycosyltransferase